MKRNPNDRRAPIRWGELCCGGAAVTLRLVSGAWGAPPANYMGGKRRFAPAILGAMGCDERPPVSSLVLVDAGPWGRAWKTLLRPGGNGLVVEALLAHETKCRPLFDAIAAAPQPTCDFEWTAAFLLLQSGNSRGRPIVALPDGRWRTEGYARGDLTDSPDYLAPKNVAFRVRRLASIDWPPTVVYNCDARALPTSALDLTHAYIDPPYAGTTGYGEATLPREDLLALDLQDRGAVVAVSEAEEIPDFEGFHRLDISTASRAGHAARTFAKSRREILHLSVPPRAVPATQLGLGL